MTGQRRLLEENAVMARSIRLRNLYVDPLSGPDGKVARLQLTQGGRTLPAPQVR